MNRPDLIIFDCDGVLIDSEPLASRTLSEALTAAGVAMTPLEVHQTFTGKAEVDIKRLCVEEFGLKEPNAVFSGWHKTLFETFARELKPMPGMASLVAALETAKCVASNSRQERLAASLGRTVLWPAFAPHIYGADSVARPKPAPDLLLHCAAKTGVSANACVMIDDSPHGITSARAAGMISIGFVDPADPRPDRAGVLRAAGADHVAVGAGELTSVLAALGCVTRATPEPTHEDSIHG
jgi:HAD superfamily hydrolase (TIGR01509 family)